jgi:hypothetical protein
MVTPAKKRLSAVLRRNPRRAHAIRMVLLLGAAVASLIWMIASASAPPA